MYLITRQAAETSDGQVKELIILTYPWIFNYKTTNKCRIRGTWTSV